MGKRILLVEDDAIVAMHLQGVVEQLGYEVVGLLATGEEGIEHAAALRPDVVLMDIRLRGDMTGIQAAEQIHKRSGTPVIFLTAYSDESTLNQAKQTQAYGYLTKPIREKELRASIEMAIYKSQTDRTLEHLNQVLRALREVNQLITREKDPRRLLEQACEALVRSRGYVLVGVLQASGGDPIPRPLAIAGPGRDLWEIIGSSQEKERIAQLPGSEALRTRQPVVCNDAGNDPRYAPWKDALLERAVSASAAAPMVLGERLFGVLYVCSDHANAFSPEELGLLQELARDLAFSLKSNEDETGRRLLEEQMLQAQKMESIGRLAGGVAHDFNNCLQGILGFTEGLVVQVDENSPLQPDLAEIKQLVLQARDLTRQLLAFSRRQVIRPRLLDLNALIGEQPKMLGRLIGEDITLDFRLDSNPLWVQADPTQVQQVLMNLVVNARDAMPKGGPLTVTTGPMTFSEKNIPAGSEARPGRFICLSVSDSGTGMSPETLSQIFEPFFTTKERGKGTGLGLAVVHGVVKQSNGWIEVESHLGLGSAFKVFLPAAEPEGTVRETAESEIPPPLGKGERVLLVEDERGARVSAVRALRGHGYTVWEAANATEARDLFARESRSFDILVSDVVLPDGNGLDLVQEFVTENSELRVVLASGYVDQKSRCTEVSEKGYCFLQKPYQTADLLRAVAAELSARLSPAAVAAP